MLKSPPPSPRSAAEIPLSQLSFDESRDALGHGAISASFKAQCRGQQVAVKRFLEPETEEARATLLRLIRTLQAVATHPNVLHYFGSVTSEAQIMLVSEYLVNGNLHRALHGGLAGAGEEVSDSRPSLSFFRRLKIAQHVVCGMNWLHTCKPPVLHGDLKSYHILLNGNYDAVVSGYGFQQLLQSTPLTASSAAYSAPEVLRGEGASKASDVFSFGVVLWELVSGEEPWSATSKEDIIEYVIEGDERLEMPSDTPQQLQELIQQCWRANPSDRPEFEQMMHNPTLAGPERNMTAKAAALLGDASPRTAEGGSDGGNNNTTSFSSDNQSLVLFKRAAIVHELGFDPLAVQVWCRPGLFGCDRCSWQALLQALEHVVGMQYDCDDDRWKCLYYLLGQDESDTVHIDAFKRVLQWFGPLDGQQFLARVNDVTAHQWFHGNVSRQAAEALVQQPVGNKQKSGTWLLRFGSVPGTYTLTVLKKEKKVGRAKKWVIQHYRIWRSAEDNRFTLNAKDDYESVSALVKANIKALGLKTVAAGSKYYFDRLRTEYAQPPETSESVVDSDWFQPEENSEDDTAAIHIAE